MCDYCDCRSHPQIASLSAEHELMLSLLGELEQAVDDEDAERAVVLTARLDGALGSHTAREEQGVFSQLCLVEVDRDYVARFESDHHEVDRLLARGPLDGPWQERAGDLIRLLRDHIAREES